MNSRAILILFILMVIGLGFIKVNSNKKLNTEGVIVPVKKPEQAQTIINKTEPKVVETKATEVTPIDSSQKWIKKETQTIAAKATNLDPKVLQLSLNAYQKLRKKGLDKEQVLTVIDYSKPSNERRLWVIDLKNEKILFNTLVAHGKNTGKLHATDFSNKPSSLKSSFGVFVTDETYEGNHGYSLRIKGLEQGINDNVYKRSIVFHGAAYVSEGVAKIRGMIGRSWGCMAVSNDTIKPLINTIKDKTIVFAYFPDPKWLKNSKFLSS